MVYEQRTLTEIIASDLEEMKDKRTPVKPSLFEKMGVKKISPYKLHVNPDDEFSDPHIGPNDSIVSNYSQIARKNASFSYDVFSEPIIVIKLACGEYLILNGHHRWAGALQAHVTKVRVSITDGT